MDKLGDMDLFVRVVRNGGLAAAGREVSLSPARMTARINELEKYYGTRLLNRSTRKVSPTEEGRNFYTACLRVLAEVEQAEARLQTGRDTLAGSLRITAPSDIGQQHIAKVINSFVKKHPHVHPCLHLNDGIINLAEQGFDLGIRYGSLADSNIVARKLASSSRVLCASPAYLRHRGTPKKPADLSKHNCLAMIRSMEPLVSWHFKKDKQRYSINIEPSRISNDGAMIRRWAVEGAGIALKSFTDITADIENNRLQIVMPDYVQDFQYMQTNDVDLHAIYPSRIYQPERVRYFINDLIEYFSKICPLTPPHTPK